MTLGDSTKRENRMANEPTTIRELLAYEDTFHQFTAEFRRMREVMVENELESVELQTGTLRYHLSKISEVMDKITPAFDRKVTPNRVRAKLEAFKKAKKSNKKG